MEILHWHGAKTVTLESAVFFVPQASKTLGTGKASLLRRSLPACTSAPPPQTECGRRGRWEVLPGSASETRGLKVWPWLIEAGRDAEEEDGQSQGGFGGAEKMEVWDGWENEASPPR